MQSSWLCLSEAATIYLKPRFSRFILGSALIASISTSLAEVLGSAIALNMLFQIPIKIGDTTIKPGDVVLGDVDGVLVVPRDIAYEVLIRAEEIKENEKVIFGWVHEGKSIQEITKEGGYF